MIELSPGGVGDEISFRQPGPGKTPEAPLDFGRARETGKNKDLYAFRTPPLRNVAVTGPWMHDGAYTSLAAAVEHHLDATNSLLNYDPLQLDIRLQDPFIDELSVLDDLLSRLDRKMRKRKKLSDDEFNDMMAFLYALTSPSVLAGDLALTIPATVPSGLPVDGLPTE